MLTLEGQYHVAPNKRLTISADTTGLPKGGSLTDLEALSRACLLNNGRCEVQVTTQNGVMQGTLTERPSRQFHRRLFEGYLAFPSRS
ncbi:hypothetical protein [Deinococcus gobiensis]|uniref:Uncharacterized protein n=1 Tax=Deinococcus gobiensis (strain DSM 21396 / JCM 16679 / CGMCC 1.7299 / I-0) TaxID=745776 RepID=H8GYA1_DEIGI|nr:hypothetical protein [Deinococcus gobiensis]AFD26029.1 hypothetical protein DGo_CA2102 [Deinococcus gobiensis I-0]